MKDKKIMNTLFREKPFMMIVSLYEKDSIYASSLAKLVDCTYSHVVKVLKEFSKHGLVEFKKQGRIKKVILTKKGKELARHLKMALDVLS